RARVQHAHRVVRADDGEVLADTYLPPARHARRQHLRDARAARVHGEVTTAAVPRRAAARSLDEIRVVVVPWVLARGLVLASLALTRHVVSLERASARP